MRRKTNIKRWRPSERGSTVLMGLMSAVVLGAMAMGVSSLQMNLGHQAKYSRYKDNRDGVAQILASVVRQDVLCQNNLSFPPPNNTFDPSLLRTTQGQSVRLTLPHIKQGEDQFIPPANTGQRLVIPANNGNQDTIARALGVQVSKLFIRQPLLTGSSSPDPEFDPVPVPNFDQTRYFAELVMVPNIYNDGNWQDSVGVVGPKVVGNIELVRDNNTGAVISCGAKGSPAQVCRDMGCHFTEKNECHCAVSYQETDCSQQYDGLGYLVGVDENGVGICANGLFDCGDQFLIGIDGTTNPPTPECVPWNILAPAPVDPPPPEPPDPGGSETATIYLQATLQSNCFSCYNGPNLTAQITKGQQVTTGSANCQCDVMNGQGVSAYICEGAVTYDGETRSFEFEHGGTVTIKGETFDIVWQGGASGGGGSTGHVCHGRWL